MNTNENDSGTLKFSNPVSTVKEETKVKRPDFNEWILTEEGKKCNDFSSLTGRAYLQNRLFWAFDAGRNCIWDQFQETKKENQELKARVKDFEFAASVNHDAYNKQKALNAEMLEALEKAQRAIQQAATESYREEIQRYLSGGYTEMIQAACFKDSLGIDSAINKAKGL